MRFALWDIDNCLADDMWRQPLIAWEKEGEERYDLYNAGMLSDPVAHKTEFEFMCCFTFPVFFTGRTEKWRTETVAWLMNHLGMTDPLVYMREIGDGAAPAALKKRMLAQFMTGNHVRTHDIVAAFDDVPAIVDMYQQAGISNACRLAIHDDISGVYRGKDLSFITTA